MTARHIIQATILERGVVQREPDGYRIGRRERPIRNVEMEGRRMAAFPLLPSAPACRLPFLSTITESIQGPYARGLLLPPSTSGITRPGRQQPGLTPPAPIDASGNPAPPGSQWRR